MKTTINLLPPDKKQAMQSAFVFAYAQSILVVVFILTAIVASTLLGVRFLLMGTYTDLANQAGPNAQEYSTVSDEIEKINLYIDQLDRLTASRVSWSSVIDSLVEMLPENMILERISISDKGRIIFTGIAKKRGDVLTLDSRLKSSSMFADVKSPLSNILQPDNVRFEFEVRYTGLDGLLSEETSQPKKP